MKIIVPMAGLGTRFAKVADQNPEYKKPKPFIQVRNKPMVRWATGSLPFLRHPEERKNENHRVEPDDLIFIILKSQNDEHGIEDELRKIYSNYINVIILPEVTRGAAETAFNAIKFVDTDEEIIITDSDHHFSGYNLMKVIDNRHKDTAGIIPVFRARNEGIPKWSYTLIREDGSTLAERVAEKDRELMEKGAFANIGAYYFSKAKHFFTEAEDTIKKNLTTGEKGKGEFYVAPLYQKLIEKNYLVEVAITPEVWGLGTPDDLEYFLINYNHEKN